MSSNVDKPNQLDPNSEAKTGSNICFGSKNGSNRDAYALFPSLSTPETMLGGDTISVESPFS